MIVVLIRVLNQSLIFLYLTHNGKPDVCYFSRAFYGGVTRV